MADRARPQRPALVPRSVRVRILAWVVLLTALGLAGAGAAVYALERARIDVRVDASLGQEIDEFEAFQSRGVDPVTGAEFATARRLLQVALERNVPSENESLLTFLDGRVVFVQGARGNALAGSAEFVAAVNARPQGGTGTVLANGDTVRFAAKAIVEERGTSGAYVVASFVDDEYTELADLMRLYGLVAGCALIAVAMTAWGVAGRLLRPIRDLTTTARHIEDTDLTKRIEVTGHDDLSELTRTFNDMLERLEDAFATQRRFLDDAGHELRTPLTIVRGHLELLAADNVEDVRATRSLVLDELDRMGRLVDDLIVLARADRPDFLRMRPVAVAALTDEVLDKAWALGERTWEVDARAQATVILDPQRVTQALLQLAENAVRHTREADVVAIGSRVNASTLRLWIRDTGPGVPAADAARIFERFERGADARRGEGSGLGLSIVRAVAEAHGGTAGVTATPGGGATFTVEIPLERAPTAGLPALGDRQSAPFPPTAIPDREAAGLEPVPMDWQRR